MLSNPSATPITLNYVIGTYRKWAVGIEYVLAVANDSDGIGN